MRSILIVKTSAIGDVIHAFPVLEYLRAKFPSAQIDWVVEKGIAELLRAHPMLSNVLTIDTKCWRKTILSPQTYHHMRQSYAELRRTHYDLLFDLQGNSKSALVTAFAKASVKVGYSWKSAREKTNIFATRTRFNVLKECTVRQQYLHLVQTYFQDEDAFQSSGTELTLNPDDQACRVPINPPCLMVACGSKWANKQLGFSTLQTLLNKIAKNYPFSFLLVYGNAEEKQLLERLNIERSTLVGGMSLPLWQALMARVDGVLAVDSAALHLCATTATPSFSVFGPTSAQMYKPSEERHAAIQGTCPYGQTFTRTCPQLRTCITGACIKDINSDLLYQAFQAWARKQHLVEI